MQKGSCGLNSSGRDKTYGGGSTLSNFENLPFCRAKMAVQ